MMPSCALNSDFSTEYNTKSFYPLANLFFITCLFPFVSFYPIQNDMQPLAGILALIIIAKNPVFTKQESGCLLFLVIMLFYINPFHGFDEFQVSKVLMVPYGIILFIAFGRVVEFFSVKVFNAVVAIYFFAGVLTWIFPDPMLYLQSFIVRAVKVSDLEGVRGISVFSTEPGLLAAVLIGLLFLNDYFLSMKKLSKKRYIFNALMIFSVLLLTKSGAAVLYLLLYCIFLIRNFDFRMFLLVLLVFFIFLLGLGFLYHNYEFFRVNRGMSFFYSLLYGDKVLTEDLSMHIRWYSLYIGLESISRYWFGVGWNAASAMTPENYPKF